MNFKHGQHTSPEYNTWKGIKRRCLSPSCPGWHRYGGRGIKMHPTWVHDFAAFLRDVGPRPSPRHSIERIDNDGHYEPGNVRWATRKEQANNRSDNRRLTLRGETMTMYQWARRAGVNPATLHSRLDHGWSLDRALSTPPQEKLDEQIVRYIRQSRKTVAALAAELGVGTSTISRVRLRQTRAQVV